MVRTKTFRAPAKRRTAAEEEEDRLDAVWTEKQQMEEEEWKKAAAIEDEEEVNMTKEAAAEDSASDSDEDLAEEAKKVTTNGRVANGDIIWIRWKSSPLWPALVKTVQKKKFTYVFFPLPKDGAHPSVFSSGFRGTFYAFREEDAMPSEGDQSLKEAIIDARKQLKKIGKKEGSAIAPRPSQATPAHEKKTKASGTKQTANVVAGDAEKEYEPPKKKTRSLIVSKTKTKDEAEKSARRSTTAVVFKKNDETVAPKKVRKEDLKTTTRSGGRSKNVSALNKDAQPAVQKKLNEAVLHKKNEETPKVSGGKTTPKRVSASKSAPTTTEAVTRNVVLRKRKEKAAAPKKDESAINTRRSSRICALADQKETKTSAIQKKAMNVAGPKK